MPSLTETTGRVVAWTKNGGKAKLGAHGTTAGGAVLATIFAIQQIFGPLSGLAEIPDLKMKADTVVAVAAKVDSLEKGLDRIAANLDKLMLSQGVRPTPRDEPQTAVVFYDDSTGRGVYTKGDSVWVPKEKSVLSPR